MLFNSSTFAIFYVGVFTLYWLVRARRPQNVLLLAASWVFYGAWSWKFLLLLIGSTVVDYCCGLLIERAPDPRRKRIVLLVSVIGNLAFLATFKYLGFLIAQFAGLLETIGLEAHLPILRIVLPIGISFYTFQSLGYTIDVYRGKVKAIRDPLDYALYVAFFPQLVAGPIERAGHLLPQIQSARQWSATAFESGLQLAFWGLFKKVVIADNLAMYVDSVYGSPERFSGSVLSTATVFFAFQIYCDFSGYTDIARGVARMLGFDLIRNFDYPYTSRTPVEFWQRWHMSLSLWFRDYLYYPLALRYMRRGGRASKYKAHIVAMALIGLWHGANWTFLAFGLYWGLVIAIYLAAVDRAAAAPRRDSSPRLALEIGVLRSAGSVVLMFAAACVGWVLFRAETISDAWHVLTHFVSTEGVDRIGGVDVLDASILWSLVVGVYVAEWVYRRVPELRSALESARLPGIVGRYAIITAMIVAHSAANLDAARPFIYFQF